MLGIKKGGSSGLWYGVMMFSIYCVYGLSFWYGSKLVREDDDYTPGIMLTVSTYAFRGIDARHQFPIFAIDENSIDSI